MKTYSMKCSCGQVMKVSADNRDEAVDKMKAMMDEAGVSAHWGEFHKDVNDPKPTVEQVHAMVEQYLVEGDAGEVVAPNS